MMRLQTSTSRKARILSVAAALVVGAALAVGTAIAQQNQNFDNVQIDTVKVRDNVYMLVGAGGNTTVFTGSDGIMVVDTQFAPLSTKILSAIRAISDGPIRYIVNTQVPFAAWPTETYITKKREFLFNGEAVQIIHEPDAHTDGDSLVFFRKADVLATGDLFTTVMYPFIDVANGGTIDGYINALNAIMDITVASNVNEGGTMVIPGHGRVSDEQDVTEYRNMATIVRDRIKEYVKRGMTLEQVKAKKPTLDFDPRYGSDSGFWRTSMFVEAMTKI